MKKTVYAIITISLIALIFSCSGKSVPRADISFFYLELCPSCEEYVIAENLAEEVTGLGGKALNIINGEDAQEMKSFLTEKGIADISHSLPLLVIEDDYIVGYEEISEKIESMTKK